MIPGRRGSGWHRPTAQTLRRILAPGRKRPTLQDIMPPGRALDTCGRQHVVGRSAINGSSPWQSQTAAGSCECGDPGGCSVVLYRQRRNPDSVFSVREHVRNMYFLRSLRMHRKNVAGSVARTRATALAKGRNASHSGQGHRPTMISSQFPPDSPRTGAGAGGGWRGQSSRPPITWARVQQPGGSHAVSS